MIEAGKPSKPAISRKAPRDSLYLNAELAVAGMRKAVPVRVRNLSEGGMMVAFDGTLPEGVAVETDLRGVGPVVGTITWVASGRAGITFDGDIDPKLARVTGAANSMLPPYKPPEMYTRRPGLRTIR